MAGNRSVSRRFGKRFAVRFAATTADLRDVDRLRSLCFRACKGSDLDRFDARCRHVMIHEQASRRLACSFRLLHLPAGAGITSSYSAQFYELSALAGYGSAMVEIGRFCTHPGFRHPDILRLAWAALTRFVEENGVGLLFGCSSFAGLDGATHARSFALLGERHLAPKRWLPREKAEKVVRFAHDVTMGKEEISNAMKGLPPLLRSYLMLGGWVSDHAVVDDDLNTMHVFTGLEVKAIPATRARTLRADSLATFNIL